MRARGWAARWRRAARTLRWYLRGISGADAYDRYLDHHRRAHPSAHAMTEREFWRDKTDAMERNPKARCC